MSDASDQQKAEGHDLLALEIWRDVRPYLRAAISDLLVAVILWGGLWIFKKAISLTPLDGWIGDALEAIHSISALLGFAVYSGLFAWDIIIIRIGKAKQEKQKHDGSTPPV